MKIKIFFLSISLLILGLVTLLPSTTQAVDVIAPGVCDRYISDGNIDPNAPAVCRDNHTIQNPKPKEDNNPIFGKNGILTTVINVLSLIVAIIAIISIVFAGLKFVTSGNNPQEVGKAREIIIYACIGLAVAAMAQVLVRFILTRVFG